MGRKIDMKKIEDVTKCQVTFSKRRSSLMKKANEIAICCDIDVAFVAFSPSGRVSKFCNQKRIEEVLHRYVNLPADKRLIHMSNIQGKLEKLKQLGHINGETSKLHYLDKQMENLELQIKKTGLELQILETDLRDYETGSELEPSLHQLSWCERNLKQSLQRVITRKMELVELESRSQKPFPMTFNQNEVVPNVPTADQILMQLDPWISPYSAKVRECIFQDLVGQAKQPVIENISNFPPKQPPMMDQPLFNFHDQNNVNALKQSMMMDQTLFNFHEQNNVSAYHASSVVFSDAIHMSTQTLCNTQDPRSTTKNPNVGENSNLMTQFSNMEGSQETGQANKGDNNLFVNANNTTTTITTTTTTTNDYIVACDDFHTANVDQIQRNLQPHDARYGNLLGDTNEDVWASNLQKSSPWEWEDLLLDENFNFQNFP